MSISTAPEYVMSFTQGPERERDHEEPMTAMESLFRLSCDLEDDGCEVSWLKKKVCKEMARPV